MDTAWSQCNVAPGSAVKTATSRDYMSSQALWREDMCCHNAREGVVSRCVVAMHRQGVMRRQGVMCRQAMRRHNALSGGNASSVSLQLVVRGQCVVTSIVASGFF